MSFAPRKHPIQLLSAVAIFFSLSCGDRSTPTSPRAAPNTPASKVIFDGAHGGDADVFFLPPMVSNPVGKPGYGDAFAANADVSFKIVDVTSNTLVLTLSGSAVTMSLTDQLYQANWDTKNPILDPAHTYEVQVWINGTKFAWADVNVAANGSELKNTNTNEFIPLLDGRTLPIKVRVERCAVLATCSSQIVPATIPNGTDITVKTDDGKHWITFRGDGGNWNNQGVDAAVTVEDVTSQFGGTAAGCAQGLTNVIVQGLCVKITTVPAVTLKIKAAVCVTLPLYPSDYTEWQLLKYDAGTPPQRKFLSDPPAYAACPNTPSQIGSASQSQHLLFRLASRVGNAVGRLFEPKLLYAFDAGVGGTLDIGDGFSFFAPARPLAMQKVAGDGQSAPVGTVIPTHPTVTIVRTHHSTSPYSGATVTCTVTGGGGSVAAGGTATETPAASGIYVCPDWTLGPAAGSNTLMVTANVLDAGSLNGSQTFTATAALQPSIASLTFPTTSLTLEDPTGVFYNVTIANPTGTIQNGIALQGEIVQGSSVRAAGGFGANCPPNTAFVLPTPSCTMNGLTANARNAAGGGGILVPGPATFRLTLSQTIGETTTTLHVRAVPITLVALPNPVLALKNFDPEPDFITYNLTVTNRSSYPNELFAQYTGGCGPGQLTSSRTWVDIYRADAVRLFGFCQLGAAADLDGIWFSVVPGAQPPGAYITLNDRLTSKLYTSNTVSLSTAPVLALKSIQDTPTGRQYNLTVTNRSIYANAMFAQYAGGCGEGQTTSGRTWVDIYDQANAFVYGFCQFSASGDLDLIWFVVPTGGTKPTSVYIKLVDRLMNNFYQSNSISIP